MSGFFRTVCGTICGLLLLCNLGAKTYAAGRCLTDVLDKGTKVYVKTVDFSFELQLQKENDPITIGNPQEVLNKEGALKKNFSYTLPSDKLDELKKKIHKLGKNIKVQTENGHRYWLPKETPFKLESPAAYYTAIIPEKIKLKQKGSAPGEYVLLKDLTVNVTPPKSSQVTLELDLQTIVERIPDPKASSMGTTLTVEPKRAPLGGYVKLTINKRDFDFVKAQFFVCLRLRGQDESGERKFFASNDVELQKVKREEAVLQARIPEKIDGLSGVYFAQPVDLVVVATIPGDEANRAEVMTQEFSVSSRWLASVVWGFAFLIPWFFAAFIRGFRDFLETANKNLTTTQEELKKATQAKDKEKIKELKKKVQKQKEALARAMARSDKWWKRWEFSFNPIWMVSGKVGGASLSLAQILLWSILVFSASFYVLVVSGKLLDLTTDVLVLLGIAGGASVIAKITASFKDGKGQELAGSIDKEPEWLDLIKTEGRPDLYKFQMALFTVLAAVFVTGKIYGTLEFPVLPAGLLTLIGISNGVYLTAKASSKTAFEELAEIDRERQEAKKNLEKLKNEAAELEKSLNETKKKLEEAKTAQKQAEIDELTPKVTEQEEALKKAKTAVTEAQTSFDKLQKDFDDKKKQALQ